MSKFCQQSKYVCIIKYCTSKDKNQVHKKMIVWLLTFLFVLGGGLDNADKVGRKHSNLSAGQTTSPPTLLSLTYQRQFIIIHDGGVVLLNTKSNGSKMFLEKKSHRKKKVI